MGGYHGVGAAQGAQGPEAGKGEALAEQGWEPGGHTSSFLWGKEREV